MWATIAERLGFRLFMAVTCLVFAMTGSSNGVETSLGGSIVNRLDDRTLDYRKSARRPKHINEIARQLQPLLGEHYFVHEMPVENVVKVDLIVFPPHAGRASWTMVTAGMSDRPMNLPETLTADEQKHLELVELTINLPIDAFAIDAAGQVPDSQFRQGSSAWVVALMAVLAHLPHDYDTWLGAGSSIPNGDPAEPYASDVPFSGAIVAPTDQWPEAYRTIEASDGPISILSVVPVYRDEMSFLLDKGFDALHSELEAFGFTEVIVESRPNIGKLLSAITP
jgi:hypothetical protein